jgi:hypothetical protein
MPTQPSNLRRGARIWFWLCLLAAGLNLSAEETNAPVAAAATAGPTAAAMPVASFGVVKKFMVPDYYPAPNQNQMKSLLRGEEAEPQTNGCVLIRELQVETYTPDGKIELTVHAPECLYKAEDQTASSASHIEVRSGDSKLLVEGEGFLWHNGDSTFAISNRVHTVIRPAAEKTNKKSIVP